MNKLLNTTAALALAGAAFAGQAHAAATITVLHAFCAKTDCTDGALPSSPLVSDGAGNYYGTTQQGGDMNDGTVFQAHFDGTRWLVTRIYSFCAKNNCADGSQPFGGLVIDTKGNLYGSTSAGGANAKGMLFKLAPQGKKWLFSDGHDFCAAKNCTDGATPGYMTLAYQGQSSGAPYDGTSPLYGTTFLGGASSTTPVGMAFSLTPKGKGWTYKDIYDFCSQANCNDGGLAYSGVTVDGSGNLYGVAEAGGEFQNADHGGTVYKLSFNGSHWKFNLLHAFCEDTNGSGTCTDGDGPLAPPAVDADGNLFGTTYNGGANNSGSVYEIPASGKFSVLHSFCSAHGCLDGINPGPAALAIDNHGNLFGTTTAGGNKTLGDGVVFQLSGAKHTTLTTLVAFKGTNGAVPYSSVALDASGNLFGLTTGGGKNKQGVLFQVKP
jgi:uncharacterized repeat protein (TIGR03803 family)